MQHFFPLAHLYTERLIASNLSGRKGSNNKNKMYAQTRFYFGTMEGHHKISICGVVFYVEDDCKSMLLDHLKLMHSNNTLKSNEPFESGEERVAEILLEELKNGKQVITSKELDVLIHKTQYLR